MNCPRCGTANDAYETRCTRCGDRFGGSLYPSRTLGRPPVESRGAWPGNSESPRFSAVVTNAVVVPSTPTLSAEIASSLVSGASTARQLDHLVDPTHSTVEKPSVLEQQPPRLTLASPAPQPSLFAPGELNTPRPLLRIEPRGSVPPTVAPPRRKPARRRTKSDVLPFAQGTLEFLTPTAPPTRQLRTNVDAYVKCDQPIAPMKLRIAAAAVDAAYTALATVPLLGATGGYLLYKGIPLPADPLVTIAGALAVWCLVAVAYQAIFAFIKADSPGHQRLDLRILSFDGSEPTAAQRWKRLLGAGVSLASVGAGFVWAFFDEERLSWHDQISETFSTPRSSLDSNFRRQ
jgi:uncharacterized RDD family membrane protein YckC